MLPGEQQVKQNAEGVDVGGGADWTAGDLLRGGVCERQRSFAFARERHRRVVFQQLGNSKVEQLDLTIAGDEHVGRLDVAVDNQVGMRVRHRRQHIDKQPEARVDVQHALIAIHIDVLSLDVFENQIWLTVGKYAGVDQVRDVRVRQPGEEAAFSLESLLAGATDERHAQEFHRSAPDEA